MKTGVNTGPGRVAISVNVFVSNENELREAILSKADAITFDADIALIKNLPPVQTDVVIEGAGHALHGGGHKFLVENGEVTIRGLEIANGELVIGTGGTNGSLRGAFSLASDAVLIFDRSDKIVFDGEISGAGSVRQRGSGVLAFTGDNSFTGNLVIDPAGQVDIGNGGATGSIPADIKSDGLLILSRSNTYRYSGVISGLGAVTTKGNDVFLDGINTFSGGLTFFSGNVTFSEPSNLGTGPLHFLGGRLTWAEGNTSDISTRLSGGGSFDTGDNTVTFSNPIGNGQGGLRKNGPGTLVLSGFNALASTTVYRGTLRLAVNASVVPGEVYLMPFGATLDLDSGSRVGALRNDGSDNVLRLSIGDGLKPVQIDGAVTNEYPQFLNIDLKDEGTSPGRIYTLLTFGGTNMPLQHFNIRGIAGTPILEGNALKFAVGTTVHGVAITVKQRRSQVVFEVKNTGGTIATFHLSQSWWFKTPRRGKPRQEPSSAFKIVTTLDGTDVSKSIRSQTGIDTTIKAGRSARVVAEIKSKRKSASRGAVRLRLRASSLVNSSISDQSAVTIDLSETN